MTNRLERITTEYIFLEDRLRLCGEISAGKSEVIWLTQRMTQRLIPVLIQWLEQHGGDTLHAEMLHGFAQQAAWAEFSPQAPVQPDEASPSWLASSIVASSSSQTMCLTFKGSSDQHANLMLSDRSLRQWLKILQDAYINAGWSLEVWPEWVKDGIARLHSPVAGLH